MHKSGNLKKKYLKKLKMGCGFSNRTDLELKIQELVNFLLVTQMKDSQYTEQIRSSYNSNEYSKLNEKIIFILNPRTRTNNPYQTEIINLQNDVRFRSQNEEILLAFSLIFLTKSNSETLRINYNLLKETLKKELSMFKHELALFKCVLKVYYKFISADILSAHKKRVPALTFKEDHQVSELEPFYADAVIEADINKLTEITRCRVYS